MNMRELTQAPKRFFLEIWRWLWSPGGFLLAIGVWWWFGFPMPDWTNLRENYEPFVREYWMYPVGAVAVWWLWRRFSRFVRWWRDRPRKQIVEKIVYRDRTVAQLQKEQPRRSAAEVITHEYELNVRLIESLPLDEPEKRAAMKRAKAIMIKKLDYNLR